MNLSDAFPKAQPKILAIATELRGLILRIFPAAVETIDDKNIGFGYGSGYRDLVFVISLYKKHVNLGIVNGANLPDPWSLMQGTGKVHRHVKLHRMEQLQHPHLEELILAAFQAAKKRTK